MFLSDLALFQSDYGSIDSISGKDVLREEEAQIVQKLLDEHRE